MAQEIQVRADSREAGQRPALKQPIELSDNSRTVLEKRYLRKGPDGKPTETIEEMFWRVAWHVAAPEESYDGDRQAMAEEFYHLLTAKRFFPNSPTFTGAGTPLGQLAACFVLAIDDDMGRSGEGIFTTLRNAALIQQTGGGNGFSFSRLRPKGAAVASSGGQATGPVGFLRVYDQAFGEVSQGGVRRGANMGVLRIDHPDIRDFITSKVSENAITNFNISVGMTNAFMQAVKEDGDFDLINPQDGSIWETVRARELFDMIVEHAHHNGEPGMLFLDSANRDNPVPHLYQLESTNPCVTGDTRIYTDRGLLRAADLFEDGQATAVAVDGRFGLAESSTPATQVFLTGVKPVFKLQTEEGYNLRATADHQIMTDQGWVELQDLKPGDRIHILNRKGAFGRTGGETLGRVLGWLVGDSTIKSNAAVLSFSGDEKRELAPLFADYVDGLVESLTVSPSARRPVGVVEASLHDEARVSSTQLRTLAAEHGLAENQHQVPEGVFQGNEAMQRGFLQALFSAGGNFLDSGEKGASVRLAGNSLNLLEDVQRLLLNFGIASRINTHRRSAGYRALPDSQREPREHESEAQHELVISKANVATFASEIGFLISSKQAALQAGLDEAIRGPYREHFAATVESIKPDGEEAVYDLTEPLTHSFIAGGVVVHNCGEQFLGPYENCCLGSVNLGQHVTADGQVDWAKLQETVETATRFLDDVVDANTYVDSIPQLRQAAMRVRRIGLGIMGLADLMYHLGVRYGSADGIEFASQVMEFVHYHAMKTSVELAKERGPFLAYRGSLYDPDDLKWQKPAPLYPYERDWGRPAVDWDVIEQGIKQHSIRNGAQTTIAPTGTISTVAGCEGYGCEPVFALAYTRYFDDHGVRRELQYTSPLFEKALIEAGLDKQQRDAIVQHINLTGTCQDLNDVPAALRHTFIVASDVTAEEHVKMQAAMQRFVSNAISKTCNFPSTASEQDVAEAFQLAWELGCKGLTVYVAGSREKVVLETKATKSQRSADDKPRPTASTSPAEANGTGARKAAANAAPARSEVKAANNQPQRLPLFADEPKKPRANVLHGFTYRIATPLGTTFITINENGSSGDEPFEVFMHTAKVGSDTAAVSEAMGRLISYILRMNSPVAPRERLREVVRQLEGIGGMRPLGFGPNRVRSLPDGVAQVLEEYLAGTSLPKVTVVDHAKTDEEQVETEDKAVGPAPGQLPLSPAMAVSGLPGADLCPECGEPTFVREEGCRKCYSCGYSEC
ncbi:MAG: hypothetical protein GYB68_17620 [Chloroflexi bacterium]|nr:hypothetical protein [Chloroflexota bacterium]